MGDMGNEIATSNNSKTSHKDGNMASCEYVNKFIENGFRLLVNVTKSSNRLPFGKGRHLYESYPCFGNVIKAESNRVLALLSTLMRHAGFRANAFRSDDEENTDMIVEANDSILEKVGRVLDEISGICKYPQPEFCLNTTALISGSWNVYKSGISFSKAIPENSDVKNIKKPQLNFTDKINNVRDASFEPKIKYKFNMLKPLAVIEEIDEEGIIHFSHPYQFELEHFRPSTEQLTAVTPLMYKPLDETPLHMITTVDGVKSMISDLKKYREIAVDLENHSYRSFQGFTCLLQISTRDSDYIVDTLVLRNELADLNEIFTDPRITKVFHGSLSDICWLQRDFGIYVVNMFDTFEAAKLLKYPHLSLAYLLSRFCNVITNKKYQLSDWRVRPLSDNLIKYAREDTHYLLYIYDHLKNSLLEEGNGKSHLLAAVFSESTNTCLRRYEKPLWNEDGYLDLYHRSKKLFDNRQKYALKSLYEWRDNLARTCDESCGFVLPNHMMLHISEALPREAQGILACCNPIPIMVRKHLLHLHQIILKAREQPNIKPVFEEQILYRSTAENDLAGENCHLRCPHDLNHDGEFRDDLPVLISNNGNEIVTDNIKDETLIVSTPTITIFEKSAEHKAPSTQSLNIKTHLTPYQRYKLTKPFSETQDSVDEEAQNTTSILTSNKDKLEKMEGLDEISVQSAVKRKLQEDLSDVTVKTQETPKKIKEESKKSEEMNLEGNNLVPNPYHRKRSKLAFKSEVKKKNFQEVQPFEYSSVNYNKYQTYKGSAKRKNKKDN